MSDNQRNDPFDERGWAGRLPHQMAPPAELEERVVETLANRGLIERAGVVGLAPSPLFRRLLAAAACVALVAVGFLAGRLTPAGGTRVTASGPAARDTFALLLYETDGYDAPTGAERVERYHEYSAWVAAARERGQFVTGEDLAVDDGRVLVPGPDTPRITRGVRVESEAQLSGVFLITARDYADATGLAADLPHLEYGGHVVVQRVIPTDRPPEIAPEPPLG